MKSSSLSPHPALERRHFVPVIGPESTYWVKMKPARHMIRDRRAVVLSQKPFVLREYFHSSLIVERIFHSNFVCRQLREHREELLSQVSKARTGKPRRAYNEIIKEARYTPLPHGFGRDPAARKPVKTPPRDRSQDSSRISSKKQK